MIGRNSFNRISSLIRKWEGALWLAGAVGVVLIGGILSGWFWDKLGGDTESFSTTLRNVALVIGGVAAILLAVWRSRVSERQATITQYQAETAQQSLMNERYQRGAEMLGSEVLSVRLGGIYALQRLAVEHPNQYHIQIMRLFCAFVRLPTKDQSLEVGQAAIEPGTLVGRRQDVETIMEAIGSRAQSRIDIERKEDFRLDLRGANLHEAQLLGADLSNAMFHHSNLSSVNFANTDLTDSFLSYADLSRAQFHDVNFTRTRLWFTNLSGAMLQDADLPRTDFSNANLVGTNFLGANLSGANFQDAKAANAWFELANLSGASFLRADLSGARLMRADLSSAHFWDADLNQANIADANLSGAEFSVGGQQAGKGLTHVQIDQARADPNNPPELTGTADAESGEPLVWRGKPLNDEA